MHRHRAAIDEPLIIFPERTKIPKLKVSSSSNFFSLRWKKKYFGSLKCLVAAAFLKNIFLSFWASLFFSLLFFTSFVLMPSSPSIIIIIIATGSVETRVTLYPLYMKTFVRWASSAQEEESGSTSPLRGLLICQINFPTWLSPPVPNPTHFELCW